MQSNVRRYLIPIGSWAALMLGLIYLAVFALFGGQANLALALSLFAVSLSLVAYGNSIPRKGRLK
jgi:hypothetical protein